MKVAVEGNIIPLLRYFNHMCILHRGTRLHVCGCIAADPVQAPRNNKWKTHTHTHTLSTQWVHTASGDVVSDLSSMILLLITLKEEAVCLCKMEKENHAHLTWCWLTLSAFTSQLQPKWKNKLTFCPVLLLVFTLVVVKRWDLCKCKSSIQTEKTTT